MRKDDESIRKLSHKMLSSTTTPRDALPYTDEFDGLYHAFLRKHKGYTKHQFWLLLARVGKQGGLGKKNRRKGTRGRRLTRDQKLEILRLFPDGMGNRDELPYTKYFDNLYSKFSKSTGTRFSKHDFWRAISSVAKLSRKPELLFESLPLTGKSHAVEEILEFCNPWWFGNPLGPLPPHRRTVYDEIYEQFVSQDTVPVVQLRGPRQVGKTTIQKQLVEELIKLDRVPSKQILRVQFDNMPAMGALENPIIEIVRWYENNVLNSTITKSQLNDQPVYLLFDEVQNLKNWSDQVKFIADHTGASIFITGSSAMRLAEGQDSMAGRVYALELGPLRLNEIALINDISVFDSFCFGESCFLQGPDYWRELAIHAFNHGDELTYCMEQFSRLGGFPGLHDRAYDNVEDVYRHIYKDTMLRSLEEEHLSGVEEEIVEEVFRHCCRYVGDSPKLSKLRNDIVAKGFASVSQKDVEHTVDYLERTMLVRLVPPLEFARSRSKNPSKITVCDHVLRNAAASMYTPVYAPELKRKPTDVKADAGHLVESIIGYSLSCMPSLNIKYLPTSQKNPEVDFVVTHDGYRVPIEVKYRDRRFLNSDADGIRWFVAERSDECDYGIVVTQSAEHYSQNLVCIPLPAFLLAF